MKVIDSLVNWWKSAPAWQRNGALIVASFLIGLAIGSLVS